VESVALTDGTTPAPSDRWMTLLLCLVPFIVLCTLNSATYRYGASDQAFYIPAVLFNMHPDLFPRDATLIRAQAQLTLVDETVGGLSQVTGLSLPILFAALYAGSLILLAVAIWLIAMRLYRTRWAGIALLAALTLRHSISRTGTNTLEGYFHPRQLAFALGALAVGLVLRRRLTGAIVAVVLAAAVHPTTAMWFGIWVTVALAVVDRRWRAVIGVGAMVAAALGVWALTVGPLAGRLVVMDQAWLATLEEKVYLFPLDWPFAAWVTNLAPAVVIVVVYRWRRASGLVDKPETGVVFGALSLCVLFFTVLPFNALHLALAVQLQPARMFWMLDFLGTVYLVWALAEEPRLRTFVATARQGRRFRGWHRMPQRAQLVATGILVLSIVRGGYVKTIEFPERAVARIDIANDDWGRAMAWARRSTDVRSGWLADPLHAVRYGTSLRVAAERDVLVEAIKDTAIGMYERGTAMRARERLVALGDFTALDANRARALAATYDLDYLVTERTVDLPLAFESGRLRIYRLR
jgi:hypothetical protein